MKFSIATIEFWQSIGFDTANWRKSIDGTKALVHDKFASALTDLNNPNIITLDVDSEEFKQIIEEEFTEQIDNEDILLEY